MVVSMKIVASTSLRPAFEAVAKLTAQLRDPDPAVRRHAEKTLTFAERYGRKP